MDNEQQRKLKLKKKLNKIDISRSYELCTDKSKEWTAIKLTGVTDFEGVIYKYGRVSMEEQKDSEECSLQFDFDVLLSPTIEKEELETNLDFKNLMGDILVHILEDQMKEDKLQYVNSDD